MASELFQKGQTRLTENYGSSKESHLVWGWEAGEKCILDMEGWAEI
jgi:hypothetical protein